MTDATINLLKETYTKNDFGVDSATTTSRTVFCSTKSVSRADFYKAGQIGLALDFVFVTDPVNYEGETILEYEGVRYDITRVYQSSLNTLEIYAGHKVGVTSPILEVNNGLNEGDKQDTN